MQGYIFPWGKTKNRHKDTHSLSLNHHKTIARMKGVFLCLFIILLQNYITPKIYLSKILHFSKEKNR